MYNCYRNMYNCYRSMYVPELRKFVLDGRALPGRNLQF